MMTLREILARAEAQGVVLSAKEGRLFAKSSGDQPLDGEFRTILSDHKELILEWFGQETRGDSTLSGLIDAVLPLNARREAASSTQARLWYLEQVLGARCPYNEQLEIELRGPLDIDALQRAINVLVVRHPALRSGFIQDAEGDIVVEVAQDAVVPIVLEELSDRTGDDLTHAVDALSIQEGRRRFELAVAPLVRLCLLRITPQSHLLLISLHHIVMDGASMAILYDELCALYNGLVSGTSVQLTPQPIEYADYARCLVRWQRGNDCRKSLDVWEARLTGLSGRKTVPPDHERNEASGFRGGIAHFDVSPQLGRQLSQLAGSENATLYMGLFAAFKVLLARYTDETDLAVATPVANRPHPDLGGVFGLFANTLVIRSELAAAASFRQVLRIVRHSILEAFEHQHVPFDQIVERIKPERIGMAMPLTQVMFVMQPALRPLTLAGLDAQVRGPKHLGYAKFDVTLSVTRSASGALTGHCEYDADLYEFTTIKHFVEQYVALLQSIAERPDEAIGALSLTGEHDKFALLEAHRAQRVDYSQRDFVFELFERQARRAPTREAIISKGQRVSYGDASATINRLANFLTQTGLEPGARVGLHLEKSTAAVLVLFAIWKAGGVYVPIDPALPDERIRYLIDDTGMAVIVTNSSLAAALTGEKTRTIMLDESWSAIEAQSPMYAHVLPRTTESLAYILYTSGTTGRPKGVMVRHRSVTNLAYAAASTQAIDSFSRVLQFTSFSFDPSIEQIVTTLCHGGTLFPVSTHDIMPGPDLSAFIRNHAVTHANLTPSALALMPHEDLPDLRCVISGGERCTSALVERWGRGRRFLNCYGPTETTVTATASLCSPGDRQITIGRPLDNVECHVLDLQRWPVPPGVIGELYIGGAGVAAGYWQRPELTEERFVADPLDPAGRLYKTGDMVRRLADGRITFVGRRDGQLKIRGQRVEPGEIEAALNGLAGIVDSRVIVRDVPQRGDVLLAYVLPSNGTQLDTDLLLASLEAQLPRYMVPSAIIVLRAFPLTVTGKIDTYALPLPDFLAGVKRANASVPRTDTEKQVAQVWKEVLGHDVEDIDEDFFRLGGHSLTAVRLIAALKACFGIGLTLTAMLSGPTIRRLSEQLESARAPQQEWTPLINLDAGGDRIPVFCVHPAGGTVSCFKPLAEALGERGHPVFGLQPLGFEPGQVPQQSIVEMAAYYVRHLLAQHSQGPYVLLGYSAGGAVAYEMARLLSATNSSISVIGLIDTYLFDRDASIDECDETGWLLRWLSDGIHAAPGWDAAVVEGHLAEVPVETRFNTAVEFAKAAGIFPDEFDFASVRRMTATYGAHCTALAGYQPLEWPVPRVVLLRAAERAAGSASRRRGLAWPRHSGDALIERIVPGRHETVLSARHVGNIIDALAEFMEPQTPQSSTPPRIDDVLSICASEQ